MGTTSGTPVDLELTAGLPYNRRIRVVDGTNVWPNVSDFEVRSHIRTGKTPTSPLVFDLTPLISKSIDGADIVLDLELTGANTRALTKGYYDIVLSDPGETDARAIPLLYGKVKVSTLVTGGPDE